MNLQEQKEKLQEEKERLNKEFSYYKKEDPFSNSARSTTSSSEDDITETEEHDRLTATSQALKKELSQVEQALAAIENGTYGVCRVCGEKIESERLEALPTALLCFKDGRNVK